MSRGRVYVGQEYCTCDCPFKVPTMILRMVSSLTSSDPFCKAFRSSCEVGASRRSSWTMV
jgi:hypothetical protein